MFSRRRTPFSSMICDTVWISVVDRTGSSGVSRPFESIRWEAKMVFSKTSLSLRLPLDHIGRIIRHWAPTDADDIELEPSLQQLALYLLCDTVETDMAARKDGIHHCLRHYERRLDLNKFQADVKVIEVLIQQRSGG